MNSYWLESTPGTEYPAMEQDQKADVVIVGGGLAGISCAWQLRKAGLEVVVLEANRIGAGTTARTTAKVTSQHNLIYHKLLTQMGPEIASQYADANETAIREMRSIADSLNLDCDFEEQSAYVYTQQDNYRKRIEQEAEAAKHLRIQSTFVEEIPLPVEIKGAVRFDHQAQFHPRKYLLGLAEQALKNGVSLYEKTQSNELEELGQGYVIKTDRGKKIQADRVILASHYPFYNKLGMYYSRIYAERTYILALKTQEAYPGGMYITAENPTRSLRSVATPNGRLVLLVGDQHKTGQGIPPSNHYEALREFGTKLYHVTDIPYQWSTQDCMTLDGLPYVGNYTDKTPNLYVATGFGKWGMTNSTAASLILRDLIVEGRSRWQHAYHPSRKTIVASAGKFLKENMNVAEQLVEGKLTADPDDRLEPGQGKAVFHEGQRLGVYLDEKGELHVVNTTCTHMGCELNWNDAERSWDCPCHGSRFSIDGEILEGPAVKPLSMQEDTSTLHRILFEKF